jgi:glycerophosphoryl diester phosphodiesterase
VVPHAYLDHPRPVVLAHRGGDEVAPENTMAAFESAVALGVRYLETDTHLTKDGILVAFHDDRLDRVAGHPGRIADLTWPELRAIELPGGHRVPRLDDLFAAWPHVRFNVDPKSDAAADHLPEVVRRVGLGLDRLCVGAFSDARLDALRRALGPELCTSMGPRQVARLRLRSWGVPAGRFPARCAQVPVRQGPLPVADGAFVRAAHRLGLHVHVWTVNEPDEMRRLVRLGVDGLVTDRPRQLRALLEEDGMWSS